MFADRDPGDIYLVRAGGSELKRVSADSGEWEINYWPDISPDGSRAVYATTRYRWVGGPFGIRNFEIETANLDGSDPLRLTDNGWHDIAPSWAPDGSQIAFVGFAGGKFAGELYVVAADGSERNTVFDTRNPDTAAIDLGNGAVAAGLFINTSPVWSPDGITLALVVGGSVSASAGTWVYGPTGHYCFRSMALYTIKSDGTGLTPLNASPTQGYGPRTPPAWSLDGQRLAFMLDGTTTLKRELYTIGVDGSELRKIAEVGNLNGERFGTDGSLSWSPNGTEILFTVASGSGSQTGDVYIAWADRSELQRVGPGTYASWSPDGSRIAVIERFPNHYLSTMAPDGSDAMSLVTRDQDGNLKASNPNPRCFLWFCL